MKSKQLIYEVDNLSVCEKDLILYETIFHNANGYIGIRSNYEEGYPEGYDSIRGSYINGLYDVADMKQAEKLYGLVEDKQTMLNVADSQTIHIKINGQEFSMFEGELLKSKRLLNMEQGITQRSLVWRAPNGNEVEINIKRMTSFYQMSLFVIEYSIKALNFSGTIEINSLHIGDVMNYSNENDPRIASEVSKYVVPDKVCIEGGISYIMSRTSKSALLLCTAVKNILSKKATIEMQREGNTVTSNMQSNIVENETITLLKYTIFSDSVRNLNPIEKAKEEMEITLSKPIEFFYQRQKMYLDKFWDNCHLEIKADDDLTLAVNYNMYQMIQSAGKDEFCNMPAKGLSGEGYEGHYFWDIEMYIQPFFNLTNPNITKKMISYRYNTIDKARENAKILGHKKGVLYPWRTINGTECSGYFPSGTAAYHINGAIAYSIISYYLATKDINFIVEKGAEIIFETARLWVDVGHYHNGSFRINCVTGPDEYTCMVNNNYYTNVCAQYNLYWAVKFYDLLKKESMISTIIEKTGMDKEEIKEFKLAADNMYLPYDDKLGINPQDDSFLKKEVWDFKNTPSEKYPLLLNYHPLHIYRYQVCKQADTVLAHFFFEDAQSNETIHNSFEYYEKITTHDSSLSTCVFSIVASKLGLKDKAYEYFGDSAKLDLFNTHNNTKDGIHTANMGGTYMSIVYGFAGLRIKEDGIYFAPSIPDEWEEYSFKIKYEDSQIKVDIDQEGSSFTIVSGSAKNIYVYDKLYKVENNLVVSLEN